VDENTRVTKAAGVVGAATFLSRIFGFVRDVVIAAYFGAGMSSDAFFVAFRIPNLLRRLFAEGSLSIAFVPVFTEYLTQKGRQEAFRLARAAVWALSFVVALAAVLGIVLAPLIIRIIAPGFVDDPAKFALTVSLTRLTFPYIFFICLVALSMGILNTLGHFAAPALAPVLLNLAMITAAVVLSPHLENPVYGLAYGVLVGGVLQLALQVPFLVRKGVFFWQRASLRHPGLKKIGWLMLPAIFGAAVYQINILVGTLLASLLPEGSVSYLYYADRLVQFPLGIFAIAMATAVLPSISRQAAQKNFKAVEATFGHAMRLVLFITMPAMVGLIVLREPIVALLFKRGAFDLRNVQLTAQALLYYGVGLWAFSAVRVVVATFYALQDTRTPVRVAVIAVAANIILGVVLMRYLAHGGLALATSLSSMLNLILLLAALSKRLGRLHLSQITGAAFKTVFCSAAMGVVVWAMAQAIIPDLDCGIMPLFWGLAGTILAGMVIYGAFAFVFKSGEMGLIIEAARRSIGSR
jgi:putative peptidoglycan lipid II flippase